MLSVKLLSAALGREDEVKGKLTTTTVAVEEWMVNSLADLKHNPVTLLSHDRTDSHRNDGICTERNFQHRLKATLFKTLANP